MPLDKGLKVALSVMYILVVLTITLFTVAPVEAQLPVVILFSWDGVQRNHFYELLRSGQLPYISKLIESGRVLNITMDCQHETVTRPSHATMLTGVCADTFGMYKNRGETYVIPKGYTIYEKLKAHDSYIKTAHVILKSGAKSLLLGWKYPTEPFYNAKSSIDFKMTYEDTYGWTSFYKVGTRAFFMFFHMRDPDEAGHMYGENSVEYTAGIVECDRVLGLAMKSNPTAIIYVTTDHGFDEGGTDHFGQPDIWIGSNDPSINIRYEREITPHILTLFGVA